MTLSGIARFSRWTLGNGGTTAVLAPPSTPGEEQKQRPASLAKTEVPRVFAFAQDFPNPVRRSSTMRFTLKDDGHVTLRVYDMSGRQVATLFEDWSDARRGVRCLDAGAGGLFLPVGRRRQPVALEEDQSCKLMTG